MGFVLCLNTSTIQPAPLLEKIRIAARCGYQAVELWITDIQQFEEQGGRVEEVRALLDQLGLKRPSAIHLKNWSTAAGGSSTADWDQVRRRLEVAAAIGAQHIVAGPPHDPLDFNRLAEDYHRLLEMSLQYGVPASLEYLGFTQGLFRLEQAWEVLQKVNHPQATLVVDTWHNFRGESDPATLAQIPPERISIVHWNDAPSGIPRQKQTDNDRVMPGDGILPLAQVAQTLRQIGYQGAVSLELFHPGYWKQDPEQVARLGLEKMKATLGLQHSG